MKYGVYIYFSKDKRNKNEVHNDDKNEKNCLLKIIKLCISPFKKSRNAQVISRQKFSN